MTKASAKPCLGGSNAKARARRFQSQGTPKRLSRRRRSRTPKPVKHMAAERDSESASLIDPGRRHLGPGIRNQTLAKFDNRFARFLGPKCRLVGQSVGSSNFRSSGGGPDAASRHRRSGAWMWVRGMTRAGHSGCQGGLSPVQTQRVNDSCERVAVAATIRAADLSPSPHAANRRRKGDELRQFPQVLGGGRQ